VVDQIEVSEGTAVEQVVLLSPGSMSTHLSNCDKLAGWYLETRIPGSELRKYFKGRFGASSPLEIQFAAFFDSSTTTTERLDSLDAFVTAHFDSEMDVLDLVAVRDLYMLFVLAIQHERPADGFDKTRYIEYLSLRHGWYVEGALPEVAGLRPIEVWDRSTLLLTVQHLRKLNVIEENNEIKLLRTLGFHLEEGGKRYILEGQDQGYRQLFGSKAEVKVH